MITVVEITELNDPSEEAHLEKSLEAVPGVQAVRIDSQKRQAVVEHEGADPRQLIAAVRTLGYFPQA
jgi:copper chaperone CopZ